MLNVTNNNNTRNLKKAVATMAIEDMYFDKDFLLEFEKIDNGEKTYEELIQEIFKKYGC